MRGCSLARISHLLQRLEEGILAFSIIVLAGVTITNVFCRTVLNASLTFAEELAQFFIIVVTFIGLGYAAGKGRHIRMSAVYDQCGIRLRKVLMIGIAGTTALLMLLMAVYSVRYIATVYELGTVSPALQVPFYVIYAVAPVGFLLTSIQYGLTVVRNLTAPGVYLSYETRDEYEDVDALSV